jgi:hypothetical protein
MVATRTQIILSEEAVFPPIGLAQRPIRASERGRSTVFGKLYTIPFAVRDDEYRNIRSPPSPTGEVSIQYGLNLLPSHKRSISECHTSYVVLENVHTDWVIARN